MDFQDLTLIRTLQEAFREGLVKAWQQLETYPDYDVTGFERTIYPLWHAHTLNALRSAGRADLADSEGLILIGEVALSGFPKRADAFVCCPDRKQPIFAVEFKIGGRACFEADWSKIRNEWTQTSLQGAFLILVDTVGDCVDLHRMDGGILRAPHRPNFLIMPIILPVSQTTVRAEESGTYRWAHGTVDRPLHSVTLTDRVEFEGVHLWTNRILNPVCAGFHREYRNHVVDLCNFTPNMLDCLAETSPEVIILQAEESPLFNLGTSDRQRVAEYLEGKKPVAVLIGDFIGGESWMDDSIIHDLLPVVIPRRRIAFREGNGRVFFGRDIVPGDSPFLDLRSLNSVGNWVDGFVPTALREDRPVTVDLVVTRGGNTCPFVATDPARRSVWLAAGVGGWGGNLRSGYVEGYRRLWREILEKFHVVEATSEATK
jgi:hypothetical protein